MELEVHRVLVVHKGLEEHSLLVRDLEVLSRLILQEVVHHFPLHLQPLLRLELPLVVLLQVVVVLQLAKELRW